MTMTLLVAIPAGLWAIVSPVRAEEPFGEQSIEGVSQSNLVRSSSLEEESRKHVTPPPLRLGSRAALRSDAAIGFSVDGGVQVWRRGPTTLDFTVAYTAQRALGLVGVIRTLGSLESAADLGFALGPFLAIGPTVGAELRVYRQQWTDIARVVTPVAGLVLDANILRTRTWGLVIQGRMTADLTRTQLVRESAEVLSLSPFAASVGFRIHFGHGSSRR